MVQPEQHGNLAASTSATFQRLAQMSLLVLLVLGCLLVFYPFLAATLLAAVVVLSSWPVYEWLLKRMGNRESATSLLMVALLLFLFFLPASLIAANATQSLASLTEWLHLYLQASIDTPPQWLYNLPLIGDQAVEYWRRLTSERAELLKLLDLAYKPVSSFLLTAALSTLGAVLQVALVLFICFFLYRDGPVLAALLRRIADKLGGSIGVELLSLSQNTVSGVMIGILGTALGQGVVALIGFLIAGVPNVMLLAMGVFLFSVIPVGPPLFWGGAAIWLYTNGEPGWAIFIVLWGLLLVSSVDNFLKPILISHKANLPLLLIAIGVFGGIFAFGFIGMFLGPTLLAVAFVLIKSWIEGHPAAPDSPPQRKMSWHLANLPVNRKRAPSKETAEMPESTNHSASSDAQPKSEAS